VPSLNSQELLKLFQEGRSDAATAIFDRYVARLLALARTRIGPKLKRRVDAEDVVQSAYRSFFVHAKGDEYQLAEAGDLWRLLASITLHKVHKQVERQSAAKRSIDREEPATIAAENLETPEPSASEVVGIVEELQSVLATLTPHERQVLTARLQGDSLDQIGHRIGKSNRTIRRFLVTAKQKIEKRLLHDVRLDSPAERWEFEPDAPLVYSDFVLEKLIGSGGMGKVFRARDKKTGGKVAIKALHKSRQTDKRAICQFVQEANVLATLRHPNIVGVQGLGRFPAGGYFIVMDFIKGGDLQNKLCGGPLPVGEAIRIAEQIASAIGHAHEHGIVHCDLKPGNVLLDHNDQVSVSDFGFAFLVAGTSSVTRNAIGGTAGYIAPEVLYHYVEPTPAADIYGLGVLLWEMVTGTLPDDARNLDAEVQGLESVRKIVSRCLADKPRDKYDSTTALLRQLERLR
jgi:RNA polymerase sigma factor (sigma-70 family)